MLAGLRNMAVAATMLITATVAMSQVKVDKELPDYKPAGGVAGAVKSVGSDTLNNLMTLWAEEFKKAYPNVAIEIEGKGSATAPPALIEGTADVGPMSRPMKAAEIDDFKKKHGYAPTSVKVAVDALAVFVHKDNPIKQITMEQIAEMFSEGGKVNTWGDLGLDGEWKDKPISLYGRNSASGTYGFFKEHAMNKRDYRKTVKEQPGSSAVVQGAAADKFGAGYSGIGYATADVRAVPVVAKGADKAAEATAENAYSGDYALSRFLMIYVNVKPGQTPSPILGEFFKMVGSQQGQQVVVKDGYFPITKRIADENLKALNLIKEEEKK